MGSKNSKALIGFKSKLLCFVSASLLFSGCFLFHEPGNEGVKTYSRIFITDYNTAWIASIDSLKNFERAVQNRQSGVIQTAWTDSTGNQMFSDTFGESETFLKSKFRLSLTVAPGKHKGKNIVKVSVQKEMQIQRDVLESWKSVESNAVSENTILYRIERIIANKMKLKKIEDKKVQEVLQGSL